MAILIIAIFGCKQSASENNASDQNNGPKPRPLNILWIVADDLGLELGCYGYPLVKTPNLDSLAANGVRYTHFFANNPICSPSRSSLITGMYATGINSQHHRTMDMDSLPDQIKILPRVLQEEGYFTFIQNALDENRMGKTDYNFLSDFKYDGTTWNGRKPGQPFFGQLQISYPHRPFVRDSKNPIPPEQVVLPSIYPDIPILRADWAMYLESIQEMDKLVGKALKKLRDEKLLDNTIIVFFGDHGRPHLFDKQFLYDGGLRAPLIISAPKGPKNEADSNLVSGVDLAVATLKTAGVPVPQHMYGKDFLNKEYDTIIYAQRDRAGDAIDRIRALRTPNYKYIRNFRPDVPLSQESTYKRVMYPAYAAMNEMNRKGLLSPLQRKFYEPHKPVEELYAIRSDPYESENLVDSEKHKGTLNRMRELMNGYQERYDRAIYPENPLLEKEAVENAETYGNGILKKNGLDPDIGDAALLEYWKDVLLNNK